MNEKDRFELVTRNLQEVIGTEDLKKVLKKKSPSVYWGTMPTGSPHVAYFLPMIKIADFLKAGLKVKVLIADLHAALDGVPWEILNKRQKYYEALFPEILKALGVDPKKLEFIKGSDLQLNHKYFQDLLKLSTLISQKDANKASSEVVKQNDNPLLSGLLYPLMQALDEEYLKVDMQLGGLDQRKIMVLARENLPRIGYLPRIELMNPIIPGLIGKKMSASIPGSKIDLLDEEETVVKKIRNAEFSEGDANSGVMQFLKYVIFPMKLDNKEELMIERPEKFGGNISYSEFEKFEKDITSKKIHPLDVKNTTAKEINYILRRIQKNKKLFKLYEEAYKV